MNCTNLCSLDSNRPLAFSVCALVQEGKRSLLGATIFVCVCMT